MSAPSSGAGPVTAPGVRENHVVDFAEGRAIGLVPDAEIDIAGTRAVIRHA